MTEDEFCFRRWSSGKFISWLQGTSSEFDNLSFNYPEKWSGKYLETLSPKDLEQMGITDRELQRKACEIVDKFLEQYHALETENLQSVMLRVQTQATYLRQVILKRNHLQELLERAFQTKPSKLLDLENANEDVLKKKMIAFVDMVQRDIRKLEDQYLPLCFKLNKCVQHALHWLKCTPFCASPTIPIDKNKLSSACQEVRISLERCQDKNISSTVNLVTAKNQLEMMIYLCKDFIEKCRDSLYITPYRLERFYLQKDRANSFGLELSTAPNGAIYISAVHKRSPAGSRISEGDEILEVNDQVVICWNLDCVKRLIDECQREIRFLLRRRPMHTNEVIGGYNQVRPVKFGMSGGMGTLVKFQPPLNEVDSPLLERPTRAQLRHERYNKFKQPISPIPSNGAQSVPVTPLLPNRNPHSQGSRGPSPTLIMSNNPPTPVPLNSRSDDSSCDLNKSSDVTSAFGLSKSKASISVTSSTSGNSLVPEDSKLGSSMDDVGLLARAPHVESESCDSSDLDEPHTPSRNTKLRSRSAGQASDSPVKAQHNTLPEIRHHRNTSTSEKGNLNRRISCKDLGRGDCEGWLSLKKSNAITWIWVRRWCVLKKNQFYYFRNQDDSRAEGLVIITGFVVTPLIDSKVGKYSFRLYSDFVSFILASDSSQGRVKWMNKLGLVAIGVRVSSGDQIAGFHDPFSSSSRPTGVIESSATGDGPPLRKVMPGIGHTNVMYQFERRQRLDQQEALERALAAKQSQLQQQQQQQVEVFTESEEEGDDTSTLTSRKGMPLRAASKAESNSPSPNASQEHLHLTAEELGELEKLDNTITLLDQYESLSKQLNEKEIFLRDLEKSLSNIDVENVHLES